MKIKLNLRKRQLISFSENVRNAPIINNELFANIFMSNWLLTIHNFKIVFYAHTARSGEKNQQFSHTIFFCNRTVSEARASILSNRFKCCSGKKKKNLNRINEVLAHFWCWLVASTLILYVRLAASENTVYQHTISNTRTETQNYEPV